MRSGGGGCARTAHPEKLLASCSGRNRPAEQFRRDPVGPGDGNRASSSLRQLLQHFLEYREHTIIRRTKTPRAQSAPRRPRGGRKAVDSGRWDSLPEVIEADPGGHGCGERQGQACRSTAKLTETPAEAVLACRLRRSTSWRQGRPAQGSRRETGQNGKRLRHLLDDRQSLARRDGGRAQEGPGRSASPRPGAPAWFSGW